MQQNLIEQMEAFFILKALQSMEKREIHVILFFHQEHIIFLVVAVKPHVLIVLGTGRHVTQ